MKRIMSTMFCICLLMSSITAYAENGSNIDISQERRNIEKIIFDAERKAEQLTSKKYNSQRFLSSSINIQNEINSMYDKELNTILESTGKDYNIKLVSKPISNICRSGGLDSRYVNVKAPRVYATSYDYVITASAHWINKAWLKHKAPFTQDVGGHDGIGIYFGDDTNIEVLDASFHTCDCEGNWYNESIYAEDCKNSGVYYKAQDKCIGGILQEDYTFDSVYISAWPSIKGPVDTWARTHFSHTWKESGVDSATVSNGGIAVTIGNRENVWDGVTTDYCRLP